MNKEKVIQVLKKTIATSPENNHGYSNSCNDYAEPFKDLFNKLLEISLSNNWIEDTTISPISLEKVPTNTERFNYIIGYMIILLSMLED